MRAFPSDRIGRTPERPHTRNRTADERHWSSRVVRALLVLVGLVFLASVIAVIPLRWLDPPVTAFMLADEHDRVHQHWVAWDDIADSLALAAIASEDQRFFEHAGIDFDSIKKSVEESRRGAGLRGASTITQQVAKNLFLWRGRSFMRKGIEAYLALLVDLSWPKRRILEVYLNIAEFGPGVYGVGAASEIYFGKPAGAMTDAEAALLAAVLPNPIRLSASNPSDYVRERQRWIVGQMQRLRREQVLTAMRGE